MQRLEIPDRKFWEDDLEMSVGPILRSGADDGFLERWIGKRPGRQISILSRILGREVDGSVRKKKSSLQTRDGVLPYLLVDQFAKFKSKVAVVELAKGRLQPDVLGICQKEEDGDNYDTHALLFALYRQDPDNLRLVFHLDKIHKTGFARMKLKGDLRRPSNSLIQVLQADKLGKILEDFDQRKRDGRRSELKAVVPRENRLFVFIRRADRPDLILRDGGVLHGYRPEWIILDFDEGAKRVSISSISIIVPLEIANCIASEYYANSCEYDNESEITYTKQIEQFLKKLAGKETSDLLLVELVAANCPLDGSPKIKITDPDSNTIGPGIAHFEKAVGNVLGEIGRLESVKVLFRKKRVSLIFEQVNAKEGEYVVRYSDHRLNAKERDIFTKYVKEEYGITVLSTEKRFKQ
jgi:hypothetical protein